MEVKSRKVKRDVGQTDVNLHFPDFVVIVWSKFWMMVVMVEWSGVRTPQEVLPKALALHG